jgi:hypothetical protein
MLSLGEEDARGRLRERGGHAFIKWETYRRFFSLRQRAKMDKTGNTKLTGDKALEKPKVKKPSFLKPRPGAQEKVEELGLATLEAANELTLGPVDLHDSYGETRVVLLPVVPYMVHVYWDVASDELEKARDRVDDDRRSRTVLRFYDVTDIFFDGTNAHSFFDVYVELESRSRYVHLWSPDKSYFVELGLKTEDDRFFPLVRSNVAHTPSAWPAPQADEQDTAVQGNPEEGLSKAVVHENHCVDATMKAGNTQRQVKSPKVQEPRHQEKTAQKTDSAQTFPEGRVEQSGFQMGARPSFRPGAPLKEGVQAPPEKGVDVDMTEMNEKEFALGVSSEQGASSQRKNDSADG